MRLAAATLALASIAAAAPAGSAEPGHDPGSAFRDCDDCPEMVVVPAGTFVMGTPGAPVGRGAAAAEGEATVVVIARPFALGRREVTRGEYARFIADSGYEPQGGCRVWDAELARFSEDARRSWQDVGSADDWPATCVSFADAAAYVQWLAAKTGVRYRLPSEAEWEYAARAGSRTLRPWGDEAEAGCDAANTYDLVGAASFRLGWPEARCRDGYGDLAPVGQFAANAFGLYDLIGNAREWVQDCATASYVGRPTDARAWEWIGGCAERIQRGGSWLSQPDESRAASRSAAPSGERAADAGFRVARDLETRGREER
jgi:formylglycine-generating enzyme required for sulfatase activity